jgi:hypothetical protein
MDNLLVDPKTGDLWIGLLVQPLKMTDYFKDRRVSVASKCLRVCLDQEAEFPFDNHTLEEVLSTTGEGEMVGTISVCMYTEGRLLAGSVGHDMLLCETPYLIN